MGSFSEGQGSEGARALVDLRFTKRNVPLHLVDAKFSFDLFFCAALIAHVDAHHMLGDCFVSLSIVVVADNEDHVESGQNGSLEIDVLAGRLEIVVSSEDRVGCCQH